jgi:hypothetical protein
MGKKNKARQAKNFKTASHVYHPNRRLLLGISAIGLILAVVAMLGKQRDNSFVAHDTNIQKIFVSASTETPR